MAKGTKAQAHGRVTSKDGVSIAFERSGNGPPVILVDGALQSRAHGPSRPLAAQLAPQFTVFTYDRRGRGESGDTAPYAVEREVEDVEALVKEAGGQAFVYGISSGAALALEAADRNVSIEKLALYEAPFIVDDSRAPDAEDYAVRFNELVSAGRRSEAVSLFMRLVDVPGVFITLVHFLPAWSKLKAVAHTLPYDFTLLGDMRSGGPLPAGRWASVKVPTLVMAGGKSWTWIRNAQQALADVLPNAEHRTLEGQTHLVNPKALAPVLTEFFTR